MHRGISLIVKHWRKFSILLVIMLFASGCTSVRQGPSVNSLLLAEPEPVSQRAQLVIARYTHILYQAPLSDEERAELVFQRGIAYDSIGLNSLARLDYAEALRLKPDMAEAYNSVGVHYTQEGQFLQAYEAFDSTLEINPDYHFALLNRGIALYYGGRNELAARDTLAFLSQDESDPIRVVWHYIAASKVDNEAALANLRQRRETLDENIWSTSLVDFYLGKVDEAAVVAALIRDVQSQAQLNNRLCEAYFYLGKYHAQRGNKVTAANYFKLSLSTNVHEYVEHKYARIELANIRAAARAQD
ncbi:lipoprotein NlpI [Glaciecola siphonariae]|uniref:Lipoprotein NlpI n=1 Tax=Glaciecola siphonariae TaxID=521012 RepID=A0ABV9LUD2_9ALTE